LRDNVLVAIITITEESPNLRQFHCSDIPGTQEFRETLLSEAKLLGADRNKERCGERCCRQIAFMVVCVCAKKFFDR